MVSILRFSAIFPCVVRAGGMSIKFYRGSKQSGWLANTAALTPLLFHVMRAAWKSIQCIRGCMRLQIAAAPLGRYPGTGQLRQQRFLYYKVCLFYYKVYSLAGQSASAMQSYFKVVCLRMCFRIEDVS